MPHVYDTDRPNSLPRAPSWSIFRCSSLLQHSGEDRGRSRAGTELSSVSESGPLPLDAALPVAAAEAPAVPASAAAVDACSESSDDAGEVAAVKPAAVPTRRTLRSRKRTGSTAAPLAELTNSSP